MYFMIGKTIINKENLNIFIDELLNYDEKLNAKTLTLLIIDEKRLYEETLNSIMKIKTRQTMCEFAILHCLKYQNADKLNYFKQLFSQTYSDFNCENMMIK